jgi:RHS repeat-associated protein
MLDCFTLPPTVRNETHSRVWQRRFYNLTIWGEKAKLENLTYRRNNPAGQFLGGYWGSWGGAIPFGGRMLAEYSSPTGPVYFDHPNALGSGEQWTTAAGGYNGEMQFYPWGQTWMNTASGYLLYASLLLYDSETDGFQALFRYLIPQHGRWLTPDPLAGDVTNPQSLNRYAYVLNNPTSLNDPLGLESGDCSDPDYAMTHAECGGTPIPTCDGLWGCTCPSLGPIPCPVAVGGGERKAQQELHRCRRRCTNHQAYRCTY